MYSKACLKRPLKDRQNKGLNGKWQLNEGRKYCRMLPFEHSAILSTFIKLPFVIKIFVLSTLEWPFYTGFTVYCISCCFMHLDCRTFMTYITVLSVSLQVSQVSITDDDAQINRKLPKELLLRYNTKLDEILLLIAL